MFNFYFLFFIFYSIQIKQCVAGMVSLFLKWIHDYPIKRCMSLGMKAVVSSWNGDIFFADMLLYTFVPMQRGRNHDNVPSAILRCTQNEKITQLGLYMSLPKTYLTFLILELQVLSIFNFHNDMPLHYVMFGKYGTGKSFVLGTFRKASIHDLVVFKTDLNSNKAWTARIQLDNYTLNLYGEMPAVLTKAESSISDPTLQEKVTGMKMAAGGEPRSYIWLATDENVFQDPSTRGTRKSETRVQHSRMVIERNAIAAAGNYQMGGAEDGALRNRFICDTCPLHDSKEEEEGEGPNLPDDDLNTWVTCRGVITQLSDDLVNKEGLMANRLRLSQSICCHFFMVSSLGILSRREPWTDAPTKLLARNFINLVKREMICADVSVRSLKDKLLTTVTSVMLTRIVQELFMFPESKYRQMLNERRMPEIMDVCRDIHIRAWSTVQDFVTATLLMLPLWIREVEQVFSKKLLSELDLNSLRHILTNDGEHVKLAALQKRLDDHGHSFRITSDGKLDPNFVVLDTGMSRWKYVLSLAVQLGMSKDQVKGILRRFAQQKITDTWWKLWDPIPQERNAADVDLPTGQGRQGGRRRRRRSTMADAFTRPSDGLTMPISRSTPLLSTVEGSNGALKIEICTHALPRLNRMAHVPIIDRMQTLIQKTLQVKCLTGKPIHMFAGQDRRIIKINQNVPLGLISETLQFQNSFHRHAEWQEMLRASSTSAKDLGPWCKDLLRQFSDKRHIEIAHDPDVLCQRLHFERFNFSSEEHQALFEERRPFM